MRKTLLSILFLIMSVVSFFPFIAHVNAEVVFTDGFEDQTFNKWDQYGATTWSIGTFGSGTGGAADPHTGSYDAWCDATMDGDLISDDIDLLGATGASLDMWIQKDDTEVSEFILYFWNGATYYFIVDLGTLGSDDTWINYQADITSDYWISDFHIRIWNGMDNKENGWVDDVVVTKSGGGGTNYYETASQTLSWTGNSFRDWTLKRTFPQGLTFTSQSSRTWSLTRTPTQTLTFTSNALADLLEFIMASVSVGLTFSSDSSREWNMIRAFSQGVTMNSNGNRMLSAIRTATQTLTTTLSSGRTWDLSRTVSQSISFASDALADLMRIIQRSASLTLNFVSDISRTWTLARGVTQTISLDSYAGRTWNISRTVTQSMTLTSNAIANILSLIQRTASLGLSLITDSNRSWNLKRMLSQGMSFVSNVQAQLTQAGATIQRSVNLTLNFTSNALGVIRLWLLSLVVTDFDDIPLENATVALTRNNSEVTNWWSTDFNGSIPDLFLAPDDYFVEISKYEYLTSWIPTTLDGNVSLSIPLEGKIEEGAMVINSLTVPISLTALVFTVLLYYPRITKKEENPNAQIAMIAMIAWFASVVMTLHENPNTWPIALFYGGLSLACFFDVIQGAFFMDDEEDNWDLRR